jgi:hypothetical protein
MGQFSFRQFISILLVFIVAQPSQAFTSTKAIRTNHGNYSVIQMGNSKTKKVQTQIIKGPKSYSSRTDLNGDGFWDQWELNTKNVSISAANPFDGHYNKLSFVFDMPNGKITTNFAYEKRYGTYILTQKSYRPYQVFKSQNIVIGPCSSQDQRIMKLASAWNDAYNKLNRNSDSQVVFNKNPYLFSNLIGTSCMAGEFSNSITDIKSGLAEVFSNSNRIDSTSKKEGRYLQCMDSHGLGIHADRIRAKLYSEIEPYKAIDIQRGISNKSLGNPPLTISAGGGGLENPNLIDKSHEMSPQIQKLAELSEESQESSAKILEDSSKYSPLIQCSPKRNVSNALSRASWSEQQKEITLFLPKGYEIPTYEPRYSDELGDNTYRLPARKVDAHDYAKAIFHELIHASDIEEEGFTESIEDCCSLQNGYNIQEPSCKAMLSFIKRNSARQSFIEAMKSKNRDAYWAYHNELIRQMGGSSTQKEWADFLERDVIYQFKAKTDQCDKSGHCGKTIEAVLLEEKANCKKSERECLEQFNIGFKKSIRSIYIENCKGYSSQVSPLKCEDLADGFFSVFGDCDSNKHSHNFKNINNWYFALQFLFGTNSNAATGSMQKCNCFEIANTSYNDSLSNIDGSEFPTELSHISNSENNDDANAWSVVNKPGRNANSYNDQATQPVTKEMLREMSPVPHDQMNREFVDGYERRSTVMLDTASHVLARVKNEILPQAQASAMSDSNPSTLRIDDPFYSRAPASASRIDSLSSATVPPTQNSSASNTKSSWQDYAPKSSDGGSNSSSNSSNNSNPFQPNSGNSSTNTVSSTNTTGNANSSTNANTNTLSIRPQTASNSSSQQQGHSASNSSTSSNSQSNSNGQGINYNKLAKTSSKDGENQKPHQNEDHLTTNATQKNSTTNAVNGAGSRRTPASTTGSGLSASTTTNKTREPAQAKSEFTDTEELLQFLQGPYRYVNEALKSPEFIKSLIDHRVQVITTANKSIGSKSPVHVLRFDRAKGALHLLKRD